MEKVTQSNAANAEESSSASEEMNAQAEQMGNVVDDLVILVGGGRALNADTETGTSVGEAVDPEARQD